MPADRLDAIIYSTNKCLLSSQINITEVKKYRKDKEKIDNMSKHPLSLLLETKGMNGYEFKDWLEERSDNEIEDLTSLSMSLEDNVKSERKNRGWNK